MLFSFQENTTRTNLWFAPKIQALQKDDKIYKYKETKLCLLTNIALRFQIFANLIKHKQNIALITVRNLKIK